jgi:mannose-6-phosphate isomerase-like protein (cupin superfamily)
MATAADTAFKVANLAELEGDENEGRVRMDVRRNLGIRAFGTSAYRSSVAGGRLVTEHDEEGFRVSQSGQEELYAVVAGRATFTVNGEQVDAPAGSLVFVGDPVAKRSAVADEPGTIVLAIGGKPGEAFFALPEEFSAAFDAYNAKEYERSIELYRELLASGFPRKAGILYNIACNEALLGRADDAIEHLRAAIEEDGQAVELARTDSDFEPIREDPRFVELIA